MIKSFIVLHAFLLGVWGLFFFGNTEKTTPASEITICHTAPENGMKQFALDPAFQALHPAPLAINYQATGTDITFQTPDGKEARGYLIKAKGKSNKWLLVYQEWWGLNDYIKRQSDTYYKDLGEDVNVLALDMYDGKVTANPQEAGKFMSETNEARLEAIMKGGIAFAGKNAKIANVGWCFGGSLSLQSALLGGKQTVGSVMYYGMPVRDVEKLKTLNSDVLGLFATETRISKEVIEEFAANMKTAGKTLTYKIFNGVHGFANPSNPKYDEALAKEAYGMSLAYLKKKF
ncbi:dienelactone hydrolase family protein [Emticicia fluvialis]|uniref:dienelactone hydrolase family protein n=1 Tax=Emticicia fluvialis TaxID=2974474 RepID=UPI00216687FD|nr:dienelactone hydrolase family protein [Emticicia fluvialis]